MKETPSDMIQEISSSKLKMNLISKNSNPNNNNNPPSRDPSLINNMSFAHKPSGQRGKNSHNLEINYTSNTNDNNIPSTSTALLQKVVDKADVLEIEIINSLSMSSNLKIEINAFGMTQGSKRQAKDGLTFFGLIDENNIFDTNEKKDVDYIINTNEVITEENSNILGRHFCIRFDINSMKYYIKDLGCGYGTFKKIAKKAKIKDSYLLNIGNSYIVCTFGVDEYYPEGMVIPEGDKTLNIKVFSEIAQTEPHFFNPKQFKRIYIGRDISCDIIIDDSLLSRIHCTIEYDDEDGWIIYDGKIDDDESKNKLSTNGTWLYLIEEIPIEDGLIFKNNKNAFECRLINRNKK